MFDWDRNNLRKIRAHRIRREETEEALLTRRWAKARLYRGADARSLGPMNKKIPQMPRFKTESEEADWWASKAGRA